MVPKLNAKPLIRIPSEFRTHVISMYGEPGYRWVTRLPTLVEHLCQLWDLRPEGPIMHGNCAIVVKARGRGTDCALKISWQDDKTRWEGWALAAWRGRGAVRLLDSQESDGALLLEQLNSQRTLHYMAPDHAAEQAAILLHRLSVAAPACSDGPPQLRDLAEQFAHQWDHISDPIPDAIIDMGRQTCIDLGPSVADRLVNQDLHYGNILHATREPWLVIDPKVVRGDPEFGIAPLLWNRFNELSGTRDLRRRLEIIIEAAELNPLKARRWALVRVVDYWQRAIRTKSRRSSQIAETLATWLTS